MLMYICVLKAFKMRKNVRLNSLWFSFSKSMDLYLKVEKNPNHSENKKNFLLADVIEKGTPFIIEAQSNKEYANLVKKANKFFLKIINLKTMKHFTVEKLRALTMPETKAEREELVNALFDDYKNVTARIHFADTVAEGDAELKAALGDACLAIATSTNTIDGTQFQTVLPTVEHMYFMEPYFN